MTKRPAKELQVMEDSFQEHDPTPGVPLCTPCAQIAGSLQSVRMQPKITTDIVCIFLKEGAVFPL
jgi:hypothetical protein